MYEPPVIVASIIERIAELSPMWTPAPPVHTRITFTYISRIIPGKKKRILFPLKARLE